MLRPIWISFAKSNISNLALLTPVGLRHSNANQPMYAQLRLDFSPDRLKSSITRTWCGVSDRSSGPQRLNVRRLAVLTESCELSWSARHWVRNVSLAVTFSILKDLLLILWNVYFICSCPEARIIAWICFQTFPPALWLIICDLMTHRVGWLIDSQKVRWPPQWNVWLLCKLQNGPNAF